jgi:hypothetical protein
MASGQPEHGAGSQAGNAQGAGNSTGSPNSGNAGVSGQVYDYVSLAALELIPSPPSFSSCYIYLPDLALQTTITNKTEQGSQNAASPAQVQSNTSSTQGTGAASSDQPASLESLWLEAGVDLANVTPTRDEHDAYEVDPALDGMTSMTTGPSCSVCGTPMTYDNLIDGQPCKMCNFI